MGGTTPSAPQIDDNIAAFKPLNKPVDQFALAVLVFIVNIVPFRILDPLNDNLLGHLHGDAAERTGFYFHPQGVSRFRAFIQGSPGFLMSNLRFGVKHLVHDRLELENLYFSGLVVIMGFNIHILPQFFARRRQHGRLQGFRDNLLVDPPVLPHLLDQTFKVLQH